MIANQLRSRGVQDRAVLAAMEIVPRERFVPPELATFAYADRPLPIEEGQTISQPYVVALMAEAARLAASDKVLEVGTGSGYAAAVLSKIAQRVFTIERIASLADSARERLARLGYANIEVRSGDGTLGWPEQAPFDAIIVAAAGPAAPPALLDQLAVGGRLVMPIGDDARQELVRYTRVTQDETLREALGPVTFVPLIGKQGWQEADESRPTRRWRRSG
ncbi:MAG: protein-L-isoaspartate(D-aspartate) O-methyltransferase [Kofleriaceae bacterium]